MTLESFKKYYKDKTAYEKAKMIIENMLNYSNDRISAHECFERGGSREEYDYWHSEMNAMLDRCEWLCEEIRKEAGNELHDGNDAGMLPG